MRAVRENCAETEGFEPSIPFRGIHTFQACSFNHSDKSPEGPQKYGNPVFYQLLDWSELIRSKASVSRGLDCQAGSYETNQEIQILLLNRMSRGCIKMRKIALSPIHQKNRLSSVENPIKTHQATNVDTVNATVNA